MDGYEMTDTKTPSPSDAEIIALADETRTAEGGANGYILPISFARAVLARWGAQPAPVQKPQPMPDLSQLTERGATAWAGIEAQALREGRVPLTSEQHYAIRQGHEVAASDGYFGARPQIDSNDRRKVFQSGFERGWDGYGITHGGGNA